MTPADKVQLLGWIAGIILIGWTIYKIGYLKGCLVNNSHLYQKLFDQRKKFWRLYKLLSEVRKQYVAELERNSCLARANEQMFDEGLKEGMKVNCKNKLKHRGLQYFF